MDDLFQSATPEEEFFAMLHLVSSHVTREDARAVMQQWYDRLRQSPNPGQGQDQDQSLSDLTGSTWSGRGMGEGTRDGLGNENRVGNEIEDRGGEEKGEGEGAGEGEGEGLLPALGAVLYAVCHTAKRATPSSSSSSSSSAATTATATALAQVTYRPLTPPGIGAENRADMLVVVDDEAEKRVPVFVACTESPSLVIDVALSVYVRRGRMPEPGEILFCTGETTSEELFLALMRFVRAKAFGRAESVFTIADIHNLSYAQQCSLVEVLRQLLQDVYADKHSGGQASTLLLLSGQPKQVALNAMSSQLVDIPPLNPQALRAACAEAFSTHCGETVCVHSSVNGGGKSHYIMSNIAARQQNEGNIVYRKVPIRESSNSQKLVELLSSVRKFEGDRVAYHLDIAHIIPITANTSLFQLLLLGVLRDPTQSRVYYRNSRDVFFLEVPNSPQNRTAAALRFISLLPSELVQVTPATLQRYRPVFQDEWGYEIMNVPYEELLYVCKWLRAIRDKTLLPRSARYNQAFSAYTDTDLTNQECFDLLRDNCASTSGSTNTALPHYSTNTVLPYYSTNIVLPHYRPVSTAFLGVVLLLRRFHVQQLPEHGELWIVPRWRVRLDSRAGEPSSGIQ